MTALPDQRAALPATSPVLSVVVCTHGRRPQALRRCVASLQAAAASPEIEVLVIDNSADGSVFESLRSQLCTGDDSVLVVRERQKGLDFARNRGIAASRGSIVAYIDDDCVVDRQWPTAVMTAFDDSAIDGVTGRVVPANGHLPTARWFERRYSFDRGTQPLRFHRDDLRPWFPVYPYHLGTGCNMAFRRTLLDRIGGFDPALDMGTLVGGGGDLDMFARALDAGATVAYEPRAFVRHHHRDRRRALVHQFIGYGATTSALVTKWLVTRPGQRKAALAFFCWYLRDTVSGALRLKKQDPWLPWYMYAAELLGELWGPVGYVLGVGRRIGRRLP